jgi:hypothetical protein
MSLKERMVFRIKSARGDLEHVVAKENGKVVVLSGGPLLDRSDDLVGSLSVGEVSGFANQSV